MADTPTLDALQDMVRQATEAYRAAQEAAQAEARQRIVSIETAVGRLDQLLGAKGAPAGTGSIRAVRRYDEATLAQHSGKALTLILTGLEELTVTTRDIAVVVADLKRRADQQY